MKKFLLAAIVSAGSVPVFGAFTAPQVQSFSGTPTYSETLTFNQFDTLGGTRVLIGAHYTADLETSGGSFSIDNDGVEGASGSYETGTKLSLSSLDVTLTDTIGGPLLSGANSLSIMQAGPFNLTGNDGDSETAYNAGGTDWATFPGVLDTDNGTGSVHAAFFAGYIGAGSYDISVDTFQYSNLGGISGIATATTARQAAGDITVIYEYEIVPEPMTIGLLAMGGVASLRRRRQL